MYKSVLDYSAKWKRVLFSSREYTICTFLFFSLEGVGDRFSMVSQGRLELPQILLP